MGCMDREVACGRALSLYRSLVCVVMVLACTTMLRAQPHAGLAPADEYFGRMKMSILGIRNGLRTELSRMSDPRGAASGLAACHWLADAIEDWGKKYPRDNWLPGVLVSLERLYARVHTPSARAQAQRLLAWAHRRYDASPSERPVRLGTR
jgi:hypothetical protein